MLALGLTCLVTMAVFVLSGVFASCKQAGKTAPDLIILQTGRLRGNVYPAESSHVGAVPYFAFIAGYVRQVREEAEAVGADVLLVDLGDSMDGSFASYMTGTANMAEFFNALGYDAVALGNLDSSVTSEALARLKMPVLCPFVDASARVALPEASLATTIIKPRAGKITLVANFFGGVDPAGDPAQFPTSFGGVSPVAPFRNYDNLSGSIPDWEEADLRIATWMKFEPGSSQTEAFAKKLKQQGVDLVLAHRIYDRKHAEGWQVEKLDTLALPVTMNILRHNSGFVLARTDLKRSDAGWRILETKLLPMTASMASMDHDIVQHVERLFGDILARSDAVLTTLDAGLSREELLDSAHKALHAATQGQTDATLYSLASVRMELRPGPLRLGQLYDALPWTDPVVIVEMPAETAAGWAAERGLDLRMSEGQAGSASGVLRVATTRFFAELLAARDSREAPAMTMALERPLFQLVADHYRRSDGLGEMNEEQTP